MIPTSPSTSSLVDAAPRQLGSFLVGPLALGTWRLTSETEASGQELIESALGQGINLIDTADVYGLDWGGTGFGTSEDLIGRALADVASLRDQIVLATKGGIIPGVPYDSSDGYLTEAVDASLRRLHTDRIDLYQIHRPDLYTAPRDLAASMLSLREKGKVVEFGVSNFTPWQFSALQHHLPFPLVSSQPQFSASHLDPMRDGTFDLCMTHGVVPLVWSPLGGGGLVGAAPGDDGPRSELLDVLLKLADRENTDRATVALAFVLAHPARPIPILGTTKPSRIAEAVEAYRVHLSRADCYSIIESSDGVPLP